MNEEIKNRIYNALNYNDLQRETLWQIYKRNKAEKEYILLRLEKI